MTIVQHSMYKNTIGNISVIETSVSEIVYSVELITISFVFSLVRKHEFG